MMKTATVDVKAKILNANALNKKNYIIIDSINVLPKYEKDVIIIQTSNKIEKLIKQKYRNRIYIHGIIAYAMTDFEEKVLLATGFRKIKDVEDNIMLFELSKEDIDDYYLRKDKKK